MIHIGRSVAAALLIAVIGGCGAQGEQRDTGPAAVEPAAPADPVGPVDPAGPTEPASLFDLDLGAVSDFAGVPMTELDAPRHLFVLDRDGELVVLFGKDPNNGCRLDPVDAQLRSRFEYIPIDAGFWEPCHGNAYDSDGQHIEGPGDAAMWRLDTIVRGGRLVFPVSR